MLLVSPDIYRTNFLLVQIFIASESIYNFYFLKNKYMELETGKPM